MASQLEHTTSVEKLVSSVISYMAMDYSFNLKSGHNIIEFLYLKPLLAM